MRPAELQLNWHSPPNGPVLISALAGNAGLPPYSEAFMGRRRFADE